MPSTMILMHDVRNKPLIGLIFAVANHTQQDKKIGERYESVAESHESGNLQLPLSRLQFQTKL